jgi:hypothetical protein
LAVDKWGIPITFPRSKIIVIDGAVKVTRFGHLNPRDQKVGPFKDRAPENKGIWAFAYPYFDWFFAAHKWDEVVPKHLVDFDVETEGLYLDHLYANNDKSTIKEYENYRNALYEEKQEWIKNHRREMPLKHFFWQGYIWARFDRFGGIDYDWHLLSIDEYERAARKVEPKPFVSSDHMEVFLSPKQGKVVR